MAAAETPARGWAALVARHPKLLRRGGVGAVATGTIVFVLASVLTPGAGAASKQAAVAPLAHISFAPAPGAASGTHDSSPSAIAPRAVKKKAVKHRAVTKAAFTDASVSSLASNGIPSVALNAYRVAAARMSSTDPGCGIDWAMLAGIGRVESDHGRFGGAVLHSDGTSSPPIIGPALNGHGTALIPAPSDGAALDGDSVYTHALGPMQFIPQTWAGYGADADNDGRADIFDIDDAALGAARYLCAAGGNLRTQDGKVRAVLAYNHVTAYVNEVLALADAYRRGVPISGIPIGQLTGALPPVKKTGTPVNPGPPTAVGKKKAPTGTTGGTKTGGTKSGGTTSGSTSPAPTSTGTTSGPTTGSSTSHGPSSTPPSTPTSTPPGSTPTGSTPPSSPTPSPTKTCTVGLGGLCVIP